MSRLVASFGLGRGDPLGVLRHALQISREPRRAHSASVSGVATSTNGCSWSHDNAPSCTAEAISGIDCSCRATSTVDRAVRADTEGSGIVSSASRSSSTTVAASSCSRHRSRSRRAVLTVLRSASFEQQRISSTSAL